MKIPNFESSNHDGTDLLSSDSQFAEYFWALRLTETKSQKNKNVYLII
jgi:hypothetical protein